MVCCLFVCLFVYCVLFVMRGVLCDDCSLLFVVRCSWFGVRGSFFMFYFFFRCAFLRVR